MDRVKKDLFAMQDKGYRDFHAKLIPNVDKGKIIGVRTPVLRRYAKVFYYDPLCKTFLSSLPHEYYEENNLHAFLIEQIKDFDECIAALDAFLPHVDNWATCDMMRPKCFAENKEKLLLHIEKWLSSSHEYTVRYSIEMLMLHFLDVDFDSRFPEAVSNVKSDAYYVNMMRAWYFATALAMQYGAVLPYITENRLDAWTHNKTIQKAVESYRITNEQKVFLKSYILR